MIVTTCSGKVVCDEVSKENVAKSSKKMTIVFQSDALAEGLNKEVLNDGNGPQPNVNVDVAKGKEKVIPPPVPQNLLPKVKSLFS